MLQALVNYLVVRKVQSVKFLKTICVVPVLNASTHAKKMDFFILHFYVATKITLLLQYPKVHADNRFSQIAAFA